MSRTPLLIHLHIPKNAGTTLSRMLKIGVLLRPPTNALREQIVLGLYATEHTGPRLDAIERLPERDRARIRFFEAHCGYGVHERLPSPSAYVTMLREPNKRTLSVFRFLKAKGAIAPETTLDEFLRTEPRDPVWVVDNAQVRYLAGERGEHDTRPIGACTPDMLEKATERLERDFLLAGLVERYDESAALLLRELGWRFAFSFTSNVTTKKELAEGEASQDAMDRLRDLNELDTALYERAKALFDEKVRAAGPGFAREVARFRRRSEVIGGAIGKGAD
ncbi:MAG: hypothetical protein ACTS27_07225, partial [Phycisphaerales bacterium]